jgi:hypothetical protein
MRTVIIKSQFPKEKFFVFIFSSAAEKNGVHISLVTIIAAVFLLGV